MQVLIESTKFPSKALHDAGAMYSTQGQISGFNLCVLKDRGPMGAVDKKEVPPLIIIFFNFSGGPDKNQYYNESLSLCSVFNQIARGAFALHEGDQWTPDTNELHAYTGSAQTQASRKCIHM